jgi:hypothetical protein
VTRGFWMSPDGRIVAEHGHQVGNDVNRYDRWPVITRDQRGTTYLERPWRALRAADVQFAGGGVRDHR